jgi:hypothetical protein
MFGAFSFGPTGLKRNNVTTIQSAMETGSTSDGIIIFYIQYFSAADVTFEVKNC